jgi:hypothetical protein
MEEAASPAGARGRPAWGSLATILGLLALLLLAGYGLGSSGLIHISGIGGTEWGSWQFLFALSLFFLAASACAIFPGSRGGLILGASIVQLLVLLGPIKSVAAVAVYSGFYLLVLLDASWWLKAPLLGALLLSPPLMAILRPGTRLLGVIIAALYTGNFLLRSILYAYEATLKSSPARLGGYRGFLLYLLAPPLSAFKAEPVGFVALHEGLRREVDLPLMRNGLKQIALGFLYLVLFGYGSASGLLPRRLMVAQAADQLNALTVLAACHLQFLGLFLTVAGHVHVAIGMMRVLGWDIAPGFGRPYESRNVLQLWQRWNTYYRDFLLALAYYPTVIALKRRPYLAVVVAGALTFLVSGLTHSLYNAMSTPSRISLLGFLEMNGVFLAQGSLVVIWMVKGAVKRRPRAAASAAGGPTERAGPRLFHFVSIVFTITVTGLILLMFSPRNGPYEPSAFHILRAFLRPPWR